MVVYFRKSIHSLLSVFKKKGESGLKGNEDQKRLTVHYTTSQHYQENVFIEGSRPQYLEDLHTEAQEGLKILQQEVMSISPQATYLSTIIPNAVLPASFDVIEIDRSSSRTPLLSRRSDGDGSQADDFHNNSTQMPISDSGSNWSKSQSSKTIISHSSPVSSKGMSMSRCESGISESVVTGEDGKTNQNFTRSLSVMKTKQPPAPPRRTNSLHSNRIRSNSRVLVDCKDLNESLSLKMAENTVAKDTITSMDTTKSPIPISNSTGSISLNASNSPLSPTQASSNVAEKAPEPKSECTNSSPQKTPSEGGKFERTMSPSSGYSSQSGTPTLSPKGISPTSPEKPKKTPVKPDRSVSRASSSAASPSSSLTSLSSGTSESVNLHTSTCSPSPHPQGSSPDVAAKELTPNNSSSTLGVEVRQLLNIPQPPKVKAPCPPPPETWVHNRRSFELLCGPSPTISKGTQIPAETQVSSVKQAGTQTEVSNEMQELVKKQSTVDISVLEASESTAKPETLLETASDIVHKELENRDYPDIQQDATDACVDTQTQEQSSSPVVKLPESQETTPKKEPPPVMTKPVTVLHREILASKEPLMNGEQSQMSSSAKSEVDEPVKNTTIQSLYGVPALVDKRDNETDDKEVKPMQTLTVDVPKISKISPPPSPPPAYHPTPPLSRKTPTSSVSMAPEDLEKVEEESHVIESCWPPPPPPMEGDSVFDGGEEVEFPPPPPPFVAETVPKGMTKLDLSKRHTEEMVETVEDSSEAGASVHEQTPDVLPSVPQAFTDIKPEVGVQVSKDSTCDEISCRQEQNILPVSDKAQPVPPVDVPILEPITTVENTAPVSALMSSSSSQNRLSLKIENQSPSEPPVSTQPPVTIPVAPPLPAENLTHGVNFRRQPSVANRDTRSKELLSRHKSAPIPKEDANIPLVTPSLLQMVRLRSVNMTDDLVKAPTEDKSTNQGVPALENNGLPSRLGVRSSTYSYVSEQSALSQRSPDVNDMHKSPATTASFIFSRSTKKVVIETAAASCPEAQASLKESLAAELMQMSDQSKAVALSNGGVKSDKVPPPVAKKPAHGSLSPSRNDPACSAMMDVSVGGNGAIGVRNASGVTYAETTSKISISICEHDFSAVIFERQGLISAFWCTKTVYLLSV
uniref:NHS like 3 n=1 Tax=Labrus bergylta TaxID=56723 RepID=A0A3Q3GJZ0_9LABR